MKSVLVKLDLPDSYIRALKSIYSVNTAKAAVSAYLLSPVVFSHDCFLDLCSRLDSLDTRTPDGLSEFQDLYWTYTGVIIAATNTLSAFQIEKEFNDGRS